MDLGIDLGTTNSAVAGHTATGLRVFKTAEGTAWAFRQFLKRSIEGSALAKAGALLMKPVFDTVKSKLDYAEYGGSPLLGLNGMCIICHGRSSAKAIMNAIHIAATAVENDLVPSICDAVGHERKLK